MEEKNNMEGKTKTEEKKIKIACNYTGKGVVCRCWHFCYCICCSCCSTTTMHEYFQVTPKVGGDVLYKAVVNAMINKGAIRPKERNMQAELFFAGDRSRVIRREDVINFNDGDYIELDFKKV